MGYPGSQPSSAWISQRHRVGLPQSNLKSLERLHGQAKTQELRRAADVNMTVEPVLASYDVAIKHMQMSPHYAMVSD
jgi:hypothetical protein